MNQNVPNSIPSGLPFKVPCPPAALRLPPPLYKRSPEIRGPVLNPIPSPPAGARVPGDKIDWRPMEFARAATEKVFSPVKVSEPTEAILEFDSHQIWPAESERESSDHSIQRIESSEANADVGAEPLVCRGIDLVAEEATDLPERKSRDARQAKDQAEQEGMDFSPQQPEPPLADEPSSRQRITFQISSGLLVSAGDWIRDSTLGLGLILKLHTQPGEDDQHRVWFNRKTGGGTIIERHPLNHATLGVIHKSMVPKDIRDSAPEIDQQVTSKLPSCKRSTDTL